MPKFRSRVRASLGVFALVAGISWVPAAAAAQASGITIISDGPDSTGNPYDLTVVAGDSNGGGTAITSMTAHFLQGSKDVYDAKMTPVNTSNPASQTWAPASMVPAVNLVAGTYTVTVDASDGTESDTGLAAPSPLVVTYVNTIVSVTPSPSFVTEGSQNVTFSGTVTGEAKDGMNTQVPIGGVTVNVSDGSQVTTNAGGAFNYTAHGLTQSTMFDFTVAPAADGSYPAGDSGTIQISAQNATTTVSVTPSENNVSQGSEQVVFSGQVTAVPAGGGAAVPVPGATVNLSIGGGATSQVATTKSDGSFSYTASNVSAATDYLFSVPGTNLYGPGSKDVPIGTAQAATTVSVLPSVPSVTQGANNVSFAGQVTVTPPGGSPVSIGSGVPVQVNVNGQATATLTTDASGDFTYNANGLTASTSFSFSVSGTTLYSSGTANIMIPAVQAQTAVSVSPSPGTIQFGAQNVTFTGQVTVTPQNGTTPVPIGAGVPVSVTGGSFSTTVTTGTGGSFTVQVTGLASATNFTFSVASTNLYTTGSAQVQIQAAAPAQTKITVAPPGVSTFGSPSVTLTGTVTALNASSTWVNVANVPVYLNGGASPVATTNGSGQFSYVYPGPPASPTLAFSVTADPNNLYTSASTPVLVNVTPGQTTMSVQTNPAILDEGPLPVTFTVTVSVMPAGNGTTAQPIGAGVPVLVTIDGGVPMPAGTTDANGVLTDTISNVSPGDDFNFSLAAGALYTSASQDFTFGKESTTLTVQPSQPSVTEGSQNVTFSGTATGTVPGGTAVPITNAAVTLLVNGVPSVPGTVATTDSNGKFSYTAHGIAQAGTYQFSVAGKMSYTPGSASVAIGLVQAKTRITTGKILPLKYGQQATLLGSFQYQQGTTWIGLPAARVHLTEGTKSLGSVVTAGNGAFSAKLPTTNGSAWSAQAGATPLTLQAIAAGNLVIAMPTRVSTFTAALYKDRTVHSSGCLVVTAPNVRNAPMTSIQIQYATGTRGPWKVLGSLRLHNYDRKAEGCANPNESFFSGAIRTTAYNAYYRAALPWSNSFQSSVSAMVHCSRNNTEIVSFDIKPRTITSGNQSGTITGKLMHKVGNSWKPYANKLVRFPYTVAGYPGFSYLLNPSGSGTFWLRTSAQGTFSVQPKPQNVGQTFTATIYAEYAATGMDLNAWSPGIAVTVKKSTTTAIEPATAPELSAMIASAGPQAAMLAEQDLLILGRMPDEAVIF